jgi:hypothetical protein
MLSRLHTHDAISSIDSYGMRYHLTIRDPKKWEDLREDLAGFFSIQEIQPSLEDVFIRLVEGASR